MSIYYGSLVSMSTELMLQYMQGSLAAIMWKKINYDMLHHFSCTQKNDDKFQQLIPKVALVLGRIDISFGEETQELM